MMKRLFIGIGFTDELKDYFKEHQQIVGKYCETARYTAYDNFHLTLKFLGMMNDSDIVKVIDVMKSIKFEKIYLVFDHLGYFKKKNRYIVYVGPESNEKLTYLAKNLQLGLVQANLVKDEDFVYRPHVTLCRNAKLLASPDELSQKLKIKKEETINHMILYESLSINGKLTYQPLYILEV